MPAWEMQNLMDRLFEELNESPDRETVPPVQGGEWTTEALWADAGLT